MSVCKQCGAGFSCAMADPRESLDLPVPCWCASLAALSVQQAASVAAIAGGLCLCPVCLVAAIDRGAASDACAATPSPGPV